MRRTPRLGLLALGLTLLLTACTGGTPPPDLSLAGVSPSEPTVAQGGQTTLTLTLSSQNGFRGQMSLSVTEGGQAPSWLTLSPTTAQVDVPRGGQRQVQVQVSVAQNAPMGGRNLTLRVAYGNRTAERGLVLTVTPPPDFDLALGANSLTVPQGGSATLALTLTPRNGFTGTVNLSLENAPAGVDVNPKQVSVTGSNPVTQTLTVSVASSVAPGAYTLTLRATLGSLTKTANLNLEVAAPPPSPDFTLSLNPTSLTIPRGFSGTTALTLTPQNGFTGTVSLSLGNAPAGVDIDPKQVSVTGPDPVTQPLTVSVDSGVAPGTYTMDLVATSGGLTRTVRLGLTVTEASLSVVEYGPDRVPIEAEKPDDNYVYLRLSYQNLPRGTTVEFTFLDGEGNPVDWLRLNPATVQVEGSATGQLFYIRLTVLSSIPLTGAGKGYPVRLRARAGGLVAESANAVVLDVWTLRATGSFNGAFVSYANGVFVYSGHNGYDLCTRQNLHRA